MRCTLALRRKVLAVSAGVILCLGAILYVTTTIVVLDGYRALEAEDAVRNVERARYALREELRQLDTVARDWAWWDDTYTFIEDRNAAYIRSTLTDETIGGLRLNMLAFVHASGRIVYATGFDLRHGRTMSAPAGFLRYLASPNPLVRHIDEGHRVTGILLLPDGPLLVASRPILTSAGKGPSRGTLVFGRYLTADEVSRLSEVTQLTVTVHRADGAALPGDTRAALASLVGGADGQVLVRVRSADAVAGYTVLADVHGKPAVVLSVDLPRTIYQRGLGTVRYALLVLLVVGLGLGGAGAVLLDKLILSRLATQASEERYRHLFHSVPVGVYQTTPDGQIVDVNPTVVQMLGYPSLAALLASNAADLYVDPEARALWREWLVRDGMVRGFETRFRRFDGTTIWVRNNARAVRSPDGSISHFEGTIEDVTERKRAEEALRASEARYALAARGANDGLWDWDLDAGEIHFSPRWKEMLGYQEHEVNAEPEEWFGRVHPEDLPDVRLGIAAHLAGATAQFTSEHRVRHRDGTIRWVLCRGLAVRDAGGRAVRMAGAQADITERKAAEQQLLHDTLHDALTGLPNRVLLLDRLGQAVRRARRHEGCHLAVLFLDLDRFKNVNDSLGHAAGDELLVGVARRLEACLRPGDTVARLGGDEFAMLLDDITGVDDAVSIADRMQEALGPPFTLGGHEVFTTASIGIALPTADEEQPEELLRNADTAMYRAKTQGRRRYVLFERVMHDHVAALLRLETDLRRSIESGSFVVLYQPLVALDTGRIVGFEALVRWPHPTRGMLPPAEFIQVAEETGLIVPIDHQVLHEACRQLGRWQAQFPAEPPLVVSVNLSARQFARPGLVEAGEAALREAGLPPRSLMVEVTESAVMDSLDAAAVVLLRLRDLGVRVAVDDFGTGYSSLDTLRLLPIDCLKIGRTFVAEVGSSPESNKIVRMIVALGASLGVDVVAEGVETPAQLSQLRDLQCRYGQGFLFSEPLLAQETIRALSRQIYPTRSVG
ncbi:MAG: EAL domain-containing protein [bacterium]|nr:EAL domain-containing protein [bacterium]